MNLLIILFDCLKYTATGTFGETPEKILYYRAVDNYYNAT